MSSKLQFENWHISYWLALHNVVLLIVIRLGLKAVLWEICDRLSSEAYVHN